MMPAEFEPHERTLMCWPARREIYGDRFSEAEAAHAALANTIARFEPVTMVTDRATFPAATSGCGPGVDIVEIPIDDSWCRDTGPIYVIDDDGTLTGLDFEFNGWGGKFLPHDQDAQLARRITATLGHRSRRVDMVLEGGSINSDGKGHIVTTEQCLLNPNRNPALDRLRINAILGSELGARTVVWLPHGLILDHDTDGHVDNVAAFTPTGHLLLQGCTDASEADHARLAENAAVARAMAEQCGYEVSVIPVLPFIDTSAGRRVVPYLNFYVCNGCVVVPVCGHEADDDMLSLIADHFPGREVVGMDIGEILAVGGGGIHCVTQQVPRPLGGS